MVKVPTHVSEESLQPTPVNVNAAATLGNEIVDLSGGISSLGQTIEKIDNRRQTYKAEAYLAERHRDAAQIIATDPDIDGLSKRVEDRSAQDIESAGNMISSPEARNDFMAKAQMDTERRNGPLYRMIFERKSKDLKQQLVNANDSDIKEYMTLADPQERELIRQKIKDRTDVAIKDGQVNADWARTHVETLLHSADMNQVKDDMSLNATATYEQLQKGKEGLYPYLSPKERAQFGDRAQKLIEKQGSDNKLIYGIAQNHAEEQMVDKMSSGKLTQQDISNAQLMGQKGIRPRPAFVKAAQDAINDPFPTESVPEKYNKLVESIQDPNVDPMTLKLNILQARGLTPQEKAHLITAHIREDEESGKQSINQLIDQGIKQNKEALMQADKNLKTEISNRQSFLSKITSRFRDHAKDEAHLADLQKQYYSKMQGVKDDEERLKLAQDIMNRDTLKNNPGIATADPKGSVFLNKVTGEKRRYFPNGFWQLEKNTNE